MQRLSRTTHAIDRHCGSGHESGTTSILSHHQKMIAIRVGNINVAYCGAWIWHSGRDANSLHPYKFDPASLDDLVDLADQSTSIPGRTGNQGMLSEAIVVRNGAYQWPGTGRYL